MKFLGTCEGTVRHESLVSSSLERSIISHESASVTLFSIHRNHCGMYCMACLQATWILMLTCTKSLSSRKFVFCIHPLLGVLSVIDSGQSPTLKQLVMMSIHGVMMVTMSSSRLLEARKRSAMQSWCGHILPAQLGMNLIGM